MGTNRAVLAAAIAWTVFASPTPAQAAPGKPAGLIETIVHTTLRPPNWDIHLFDEPGGQPRRLTDDKWEDGPSDWGFARLPDPSG